MSIYVHGPVKSRQLGKSTVGCPLPLSFDFFFLSFPSLERRATVLRGTERRLSFAGGGGGGGTTRWEDPPLRNRVVKRRSRGATTAAYKLYATGRLRIAIWHVLTCLRVTVVQGAWRGVRYAKYHRVFK